MLLGEHKPKLNANATVADGIQLFKLPVIGL